MPTQCRRISISPQLKITPQTFIVVSTQGESDEEALEAALQTGSSYVAFVASKTKAGKTLDTLKEGGISADKLAKVRAPAGLDIQASSPEEIAVSILAEIIQVRKTNRGPVGERSRAACAETRSSRSDLRDDGGRQQS